jgi:hypothetical protein
LTSEDGVGSQQDEVEHAHKKKGLKKAKNHKK